MARRVKQTDGERPAGNTQHDNLNQANIAPNTTDAENADSKKTPDSNIIEPIAVEVRLHSNHPHDSYGRIGRRFSKDKKMTIPFDELTPAEHIAINDDIWLEVVYITEN